MNEQLSDILQQQLRDVHTPEAIGWWPLAPGWWILLAFVVLSLIAVVLFARRRRRRNRFRVWAQHELDRALIHWQSDNDSAQYLQQANVVLKRVALHLQATASAAKLSGADWSALLDAMAPGALSQDAQAALSSELYRADPSVDVEAVHPALIAWVRSCQNVEAESDPAATEAAHA